MGRDFEVTMTLRVRVEDARALIAAAADGVPEHLRHDEEVSIQAALQSLVRPPILDDLPGVAAWPGLGWIAQVDARAMQ